MIFCLVSNTNTPSLLIPTAPIAVSTVSSFCGCTPFSIFLTNITYSTNNNVLYQWQSSPKNQNLWSNINGLTTLSSMIITNQSNATDYRCLIYLSWPNMTLTSSIVQVGMPTGYCTLNTIGCSLGDTIHNFILTGELYTQINDIGTGCAPNGYDNRTQQSIRLFQSRTYTVLVSSEYPSGEMLSIWIDFNDNFRFESWEQVGLGALNGTSNTAVSVLIPSANAGATAGRHRMRAVVTWNGLPDACGTSGLYGEIHDYTVDISAYVCKFP